jgi:hypothetical protein
MFTIIPFYLSGRRELASAGELKEFLRGYRVHLSGVKIGQYAPFWAIETQHNVPVALLVKEI